MTDKNEPREKIQDVLDACGNHSLSEDTIIHIKDTLGIFVSKKLDQARAEERAVLESLVNKECFIEAGKQIDDKLIENIIRNARVNDNEILPQVFVKAIVEAYKNSIFDLIITKITKKD